jgi:hypothetical protein
MRAVAAATAGLLVIGAGVAAQAPAGAPLRVFRAPLPRTLHRGSTVTIASRVPAAFEHGTQIALRVQVGNRSGFMTPVSDNVARRGYRVVWRVPSDLPTHVTIWLAVSRHGRDLGVSQPVEPAVRG